MKDKSTLWDLPGPETLKRWDCQLKEALEFSKKPRMCFWLEESCKEWAHLEVWEVSPDKKIKHLEKKGSQYARFN